jgi:hypothetical protein
MAQEMTYELAYVIHLHKLPPTIRQGMHAFIDYYLRNSNRQVRILARPNATAAASPPVIIV